MNGKLARAKSVLRCSHCRIRYVAAPAKHVFSTYKTRVKYTLLANFIEERLTSTLNLSLVACAILYLECKNKLYFHESCFDVHSIVFLLYIWNSLGCLLRYSILPHMQHSSRPLAPDSSEKRCWQHGNYLQINCSKAANNCMQAVPNFGNFGYAACGGRLYHGAICGQLAASQLPEIRVQASDFQTAFIQKCRKLAAWAASNWVTKLHLRCSIKRKNCPKIHPETLSTRCSIVLVHIKLLESLGLVWFREIRLYFTWLPRS